MKEVSDWLGHSDISNSMNYYAHLDLETKKDVAERFKNIFPLKVLPEVLPASEEWKINTHKKYKKVAISAENGHFYRWCGRRDLNPHVINTRT